MRAAARPLALSLLAFAAALASVNAAAAGDEPRATGWQNIDLAYAPAPVLQPLKGFVPYVGQGRDFPHSLEFNYLPLAALMTGPETFHWKPLEDLLNDVAGRRCQLVLRVYLEYPGQPTGIPQFLLDAGLTTHTYLNTNTQPLPPAQITTPDYEDPKLRAALVSFIRALGRRYDGDPRLAYVTAGLLGTWGEWHTHPRHELWASKSVQEEVMDAYTASFSRTPVLVRYPAGHGDRSYAANHDRPFGYHDDSFGFATLETSRPADSWFFLARVAAAGPEAADKWRQWPIGGEIRPELWPCLWSAEGCSFGQDFARCVAETHATWLMDSSTSRKLTPDEKSRAEAAARTLGYELYVPQVRLSAPRGAEPLRIVAMMRNTGIAPFYAPWPVELAWLDNQGQTAASWRPAWRLADVLPGTPDHAFRWEIAAEHLPAGPGILALRVVHPMPGGVPLKFANAAQDQDVPGWLTLAHVSIPKPSLTEPNGGG